MVTSVRRLLIWISFLAPILPAALAIGYFVHAAVWGGDGYIALKQREFEIALLEKSLSEIRTRREELEDRTERLSSHSIDLDLLDERARAELGYARADELILIIPGTNDY